MWRHVRLGIGEARVFGLGKGGYLDVVSLSQRQS